MTTMEDKVEALKKLREKRQARAAAEKASAAEPGVGCVEPEPEVVAASSHDQEQEEERTRRNKGVDASEMKMFEASASGGSADAAFCVGHLCEVGKDGAAPDLAQAAIWYKKAANDGHPAAQWRLGEFFESGQGVEQSDASAALWFQRAAIAGHAQAQSCLGLCYEEGRGVDADDAMAFHWHLQAAEQGHALSQYCVGCCFAEGRGVGLNRKEARSWYEKSQAAGFPPAREALEELDLEPDEDEVAPDSSLYQKAAADLTSAELRELGAELDVDFSELAVRVASAMRGSTDEDAHRMLENLLDFTDFDAETSDAALEDFSPTHSQRHPAQIGESPAPAA